MGGDDLSALIAADIVSCIKARHVIPVGGDSVGDKLTGHRGACYLKTGSIYTSQLTWQRIKSRISVFCAMASP